MNDREWWEIIEICKGCIIQSCDAELGTYPKLEKDFRTFSGNLGVINQYKQLFGIAGLVQPSKDVLEENTVKVRLPEADQKIIRVEMCNVSGEHIITHFCELAAWILLHSD